MVRVLYKIEILSESTAAVSVEGATIRWSRKQEEAFYLWGDVKDGTHKQLIPALSGERRGVMIRLSIMKREGDGKSDDDEKTQHKMDAREADDFC